MLRDEPTDNTIVENGDEIGKEREIAHDAHCHRCGYNLRGLKPSGRCPECGAPVRVSLAGETLQFADPVWISRLHTGASWSCRSLGIGCTLSIAAFVIGWVFGELHDLWILLVIGVSLLCLFTGCWLLSSSNPFTACDERWYSARRIVRYTIVGGFVSSSTGIFLFSIDQGGAVWRWMILLGAPFGLTGLIGGYAFCRHCAWIARKVGDEFCESRARSYSFGYIAGWLFFGPSMVMLLLFSFSTGGVCLLLPGIVGVLGFGILILLLPTYFAERVEQNLKLAREIWNEAEDKADASP